MFICNQHLMNERLAISLFPTKTCSSHEISRITCKNIFHFINEPTYFGAVNFLWENSHRSVVCIYEINRNRLSNYKDVDGVYADELEIGDSILQAIDLIEKYVFPYVDSW